MEEPRRIALGYNNVYAVNAPSGRVLIDTGPDYAGAGEALIEALGGALPGQVVATHGHLDHAGLGHMWRDRGVPVAIAAADAHLARGAQLATAAEHAHFVQFIAESGAPGNLGAELLAGLDQRRRWSIAASKDDAYLPAGRDGRWPTGLHYHPFDPSTYVISGPLPAANGLEVVLCPGHTPGNLIVIDRREGWLFSGDQLLPDITPTPAVQSAPPGSAIKDWRFHSLPAFLASLERLRGERFTRCFPGHGEPFDDVSAVLDANIAQIEQRTARVLDAMVPLGKSSLYGLCEALYPRAVRRRFWQIAATVQGHLDLLEARGRVARFSGGYELVP